MYRTPMQIPFVTVDVFTDRKFGGNPLAVIPDGRGLTGAQMQAIAGEFNLARDHLRAAAARSCAHGRGAHLHAARRIAVRRTPQYRHRLCSGRGGKQSRPRACRAARVRGEGRARSAQPVKGGSFLIGARLTPPQSLTRGDDLDAEIIAAACSLGVSDIETANHPPCISVVRTHRWLFVELKTRAALAADAAAYRRVYQASTDRPSSIGILLYVHRSTRRLRSAGPHVRAIGRRSPRSGHRAAPMSHSAALLATTAARSPI